MWRFWLPTGLVLVFALGMSIGWGWALVGANPKAHSSAGKPILPTTDPAPPCFVAGVNCDHDLEKIEFGGQFFGYGLRLHQPSDLLSPIAGATTTGQLNFAPSAGGYHYPTISTHPNGLDDPTRLEYIFPKEVEFTVRPVQTRDVLLSLNPADTPIPPFGAYDLLIRAFDVQNQVIDPRIYLP